MTARFIHDPQDPFGGLLGLGQGEFFSPTDQLPAASPGGAPVIAVPEIVPPEFSPITAPPPEAVESLLIAASATAGATVAVTNGGMTFDLTFDVGAPASFMAGIEQAASILSATITNNITVNLAIHYTGTGGGASAGPLNGEYLNYTTVRSDLISHATPGDTTFNALPNVTTIQGQTQVAVWNAQLKLWGILGANDTTTPDGVANFSTDINPSLLVGVALHELTHALGRIPYGPPQF